MPWFTYEVQYQDAAGNITPISQATVDSGNVGKWHEMVRTICNVDSATTTHLLLIDNAQKSRGEVGEVYLNESDYLHEDIAPQEGMLLLVDGSFEQGSRYYEALAWEQAILREIANRQGGQNDQAAQHEAAKL